MKLPLRWSLGLAIAAPLSALAHGPGEPTPAAGTARSAVPDSIRVTCRVFLDVNEDGVQQPAENGLAGVRLTNGLDLLTTDSAGELDLWVDRAVYRFATLTVPAGYWPTTPWYHGVPVGTSGPDTVQFGLRQRPETASGNVMWVHIADTQVLELGAKPWEISEDFQEINALANLPLFVINTGDLVETGSDTTHWENYVAQIATSSVPVLPVAGNHDVLGVSPPLDHYERYVGPPYYELEAGAWTFVIYNSEYPGVSTPQQDTWLAGVFAASAGRHFALFQHRKLSTRPDALVNGWAAGGVVATFSGHWHALDFSRHASGILDFNVSRTAAGPLDRTPRAFGMVTCTDAGTVEYELRRLDVPHRAEITHPAAGQLVSGNLVDVLVQAYDTASPVASLTATISDSTQAAPPVMLQRNGPSLWRGTIDVSALAAGSCDLSVTGAFDDAQTIALGLAFERVADPPRLRVTGEDWPMFRRSAAGSGFVSTKLDPPLDLAWVAPVPGLVGLSSPVVAGGRVVLGCRTESEDLAGSGITCWDALTGQQLWYTPLPAGVALAPAVSEGVVIATAMSDSVFGLDAATGARVWQVAAPGGQFKMTAPVVADQEAYVGAEPNALKVRVGDGGVLWTSDYLGLEWYPYIYSAPAIGPSYAYYGFYADLTPGPDGFSVVDRATGTAVYQEQGVFRSPIWAAGTLYVVGGLRPHLQVLTARDPLGGVLWTGPGLIDRGTASPVMGHGVVVVAGEWWVYGHRASDGARLWTHNQGWQLYDMYPNRRDQKQSVSTPAITDSVAWFGSQDGYLYALRVTDGAQLWKRYFGVPVNSSPAVSGNMLYVAASDGHLYAFVGGPDGAVSADRREASQPVFRLAAPSPNPSRSGARISWTQPGPSRTRIAVFDVGGRRVKTLLDERREPGDHAVVWDGRDQGGAELASGVYFVRAQAGEDVAVKKIVHLNR